ncbi:MAG: efflux RND transporter periplasmic adaptor subunit [Thiotrichales bacterium]|nr:efflux RND transporter periplasmic adaptor subunit [Thiotrichales bacterium]
MRNFLKTNALLLTGCLLSVSAVSSVFAQTQALNMTAEQQQIMGLKTVALQQVNAYPSANYTAKAMTPLNRAHQVSATVSGKVVALHHTHGDIQKGQLIAEIESPEFMQMQQQLIAAVADLEVAKQNLKRAESLSKSGASSVKNLNSIRAEVTKLEAQKLQARSQLKMAGLPDSSLTALIKSQRIQSDLLQVFSQVDGQLYDLEVMLNQVVDKGQTLVMIGETNPMVFAAYVSQGFSTQLREGQIVNFPALNKQGEIGHVHSDVDEMTQTVDVHIKVDNADGKIFKGQLSQVQFLFNATTDSPVYEVPASALSQIGVDKVVFAETQNGIEVVPIEVLSILDGQLFFSLKMPASSNLKNIYSQGSTAIKSAFAATEEE